MRDSLPRDIARSVLRPRGIAPFLAVLKQAMHAGSRDDIETAATDGQSIFFNPNSLLASVQTNGISGRT